MASAHVLRLPSVTSRVFRTEVGTGFRNVSEWDMYQNNSEDKSNDKRNGGSEFVWFGGAQNARNRVILVEESSRTRRI